MNTDLQKAKALLEAEEYTCVLCRGQHLLVSRQRGVKPLLEWLEAEGELSGFSAADRVVGKAAAFLYLKLGVTRLYAGVISLPALDLLRRSGVACSWGSLVPAIRNRAGDGFCPMERAVLALEAPDPALAAIRSTLQALQG